VALIGDITAGMRGAWLLTRPNVRGMSPDLTGVVSASSFEARRQHTCVPVPHTDVPVTVQMPLLQRPSSVVPLQ